MRGTTAAFAVIVCLLVSAAPAPAQQTAGDLPDREMLTKVLEAWSSLDPANPATFYDKASPFPFYDVSPLKYDSFPAYMTGFKEMAATLTSLKFTLNPDLVTKPAGAGWAVSTVTLRAQMVHKNAEPMEMECRWTVVWQQKPGAKWLIVHDHFSAPYPMQ